MGIGMFFVIVGIVHLIKPDIFFRSGFFLDPANFKKYRRGVAILVLIIGVLFILFRR
jgi:hypothetical protein